MYHAQCRCESSLHSGYKPVNEGKKGFVKDGMTLSLPFRICLHKDFHARHGRPPSGGGAAPCPKLALHRLDTLTGHDERLDTHLKLPCPLQNLDPTVALV